MAMADPTSIKVVKELEDGVVIYQLYIDGGRRAVLYHRGDKVSLELQFAGDFPWDESRVFVQGLIKLAEVGDKLAGQATDVKQLLHEPTVEEIDMATKKAGAKAKAKAKKADKKAGKPSAPRETAAQMFCDLIMAGNLTDDKIFAKVKDKFGLDDKKRSYVAWYRNKLKKDGKKPPEAKE